MLEAELEVADGQVAVLKQLVVEIAVAADFVVAVDLRVSVDRKLADLDYSVELQDSVVIQVALPDSGFVVEAVVELELEPVKIVLAQGWQLDCRRLGRHSFVVELVFLDLRNRFLPVLYHLKLQEYKLADRAVAHHQKPQCLW